MSELEQQLTEAGLGRVASKLALFARETVRLTANNYDEEPTSRLGGRPNLAPDLHDFWAVDADHGMTAGLWAALIF